MRGRKEKNFSVAKLGEEAAKSMAITQRRKWLKALPVTHLAYAHHAAEVARAQFGDGLAPADDVLPEVRLTDADIEARIKEINDQFDASRPKRLRVRVKSYSKDRISIAVSDAESPARKKLMHLNRRGKTGIDIVEAINRSVRETVTAIHDERVACWFSSTYGKNCSIRRHSTLMRVSTCLFLCRRSSAADDDFSVRFPRGNGVKSPPHYLIDLS